MRIYKEEPLESSAYETKASYEFVLVIEESRIESILGVCKTLNEAIKMTHNYLDKAWKIYKVDRDQSGFLVDRRVIKSSKRKKEGG